VVRRIPAIKPGLVVHHPKTTYIAGTASEVSRFCGLDHVSMYAYPECKDIGPTVWHQIAIAAVVAMWVQRGTTDKTKRKLHMWEIVISQQVQQSLWHI
jgi:hypothetical protein